MLLTTKDIEFLKLVCWCKNIPFSAGKNPYSFYDLNGISVLEHARLIYRSKDGEHIRPRPSAYRLLTDAGINFKPDLKPQTKERVLRRRNISAQILFTFYRAGVSVFNNELNSNNSKSVYIASFAARQKDQGNPYGSTRFYGIFCTTQTAFLILYADELGVYYKNELKLFNSLTEATGIRNTSIIIMGKSTSEIAVNVLSENKEKRENAGQLKTDTLAKVFETTTLPVHFIPMGDAGAQALKFMLIPDYRDEISKSLLLDTYKPAYKGLRDTDAVHYKPPHYPAVVAVDMDVKRIDRALLSSKNAGFDKIVLYALPEQIAFLKGRYGNTGKAEILSINLNSLKKTLGFNVDLYEPSLSPYTTDEGRFFDVSALQIYRKAGKQSRPQVKPVDKP